MGHGVDDDEDVGRHDGAAAQGRSRRRRANTVLLVVTLLVLVVEAWFPFQPELPLTRRLAPTWLERGVVSFDGSSVLESAGGQAWVAAAQRSSDLHVVLELRSTRASQDGPARVLSVAQDHFHADLTVGQAGDDLVVRLRRPGSGGTGEPAYAVPDLLATPDWHRVEVVVEQGRLTIVVDGLVAVADDLGPAPLAGWAPGYEVALGDDPAGERGWVGDVRVAAAASGDVAVDLLGEDGLRPASGVVVASRARGVLDLTSGDPWAVVLLRVIGFVPLGALVQRRWRRPRRTLGVVAGVPLLLMVGKVLVSGRHPLLGDALLGAAGGAFGALAVVWHLRRRQVADGGDGPSGQRELVTTG